MPRSDAHEIEAQVRRMAPITIPPNEHERAVALYRLLLRATRKTDRQTVEYQIVGPEGERLSLPDTALYVLERAAEILARGDAIAIVPVDTQLTTQQAADMLNVSRQYLVRLLDAGTIPCTRTGKHRRVRAGDLLAYKQRRDQDRAAAFDELAAISEELGGYAELK